MKTRMLAALAGAAVALTAVSASATEYYLNGGDISAYVHDWAVGSQYTNYAFSSATSAFIGSWTVDQGPAWPTGPQVYSGLTAAALLFGGSASDYFISTADASPADINHFAWVSTYGSDPVCGGHFPCGTAVPEGYVHGTAAVPEPATWALMLGGFGLIGATLRRRPVVLAA